MPSSCLAIELNDALLAVAGPAGLLHGEPGHVAVVDGRAEFGMAALPFLKRLPRMTNSRYWRDLSRTPLTLPLPGFHSAADVASAQLAALWRRFGAGTDGALYAVPSTWTDQQCALLAEISQTLAIPVLGMVDGAVAPSRQPSPGQELVYLDAGLHELTLTRLRQGEEVSVGEHATFPRLGIEPLLLLVMDALARRFVETSRFDPLHDADAEQALFDQLPGWFAALIPGGSVRLELTTRSGVFGALVAGSQLQASITAAFEPLLQGLRAGIAERGPHLLQVHDRLAAIPGVLDALLQLPDTEVHALPAGAGALGLQARADGILQAQPRGRRALAWAPGLPGQPVPAPGSAAQAALTPTHLLFRHRALRLGPGPFRIGTELPEGEAGLALDAGLRGVSRAHCTIRAEKGAWRVFDHSRFGTWLNGHRLEGAAVLQAGDVLAVGSPPVELRLLIEAGGSDGS